jgi:methyltransferase (TIGR00027 family)
VVSNRVVSNEQPSQTALTAAAARAAHLIVDGDPPIFADPLAAALLGDQADEFISYHRAHAAHIVLASARAQVTCRSRYAEDRLASAVQRGVTQYVLLGAGLDSFAYRSELASQLRVFEVDHPATQEWKRRLLASAGIGVPGCVTFVPVDFEADSLAQYLITSGFDRSAAAVISWLGVTMYLTRAAIAQALGEVATLAAGTELIADFMLPESLRDATGRTYADLVQPAAAERGEPWLTFLAPAQASALLAEHGLRTTELVRQRDQIRADLWSRSDSLRPIELSFIAHAILAGPDQLARR